MRNQETTEYVVLGVLMTGAMHGYEINRFMSETLEGIWHISTSQLYALIHKLEEKAMVKGRISSRENLLPKKVLTLTPEGKRKFLDWVMSPTLHVRDLRMEFLTKLFFIRDLKLQGGDRLVDAQMDLLKDLREKVENAWSLEKDVYRKVVLGFKRSQIEVCVSWLNSDVVHFIEILGEQG
ncbi:MAG: PadR family transcriptional regulator [Deltaproteobacteria bacterium]|nr:PadR family transcriptional regulator [Deltaproteobacteria bacterium]